LSDVICNTSPLQYLHQLERLELLPILFGEVVVPDAVVDELAEGRRIGVAVPDPKALAWVKIRAVASPAVLPLVRDLGPGEREVLALALERHATFVLLDDGLARRVAGSLRLGVIGTLGVLLRAKLQGHLQLVGPEIDQLEALSFRLDAATRQAVMRIAGEAG